MMKKFVNVYFFLAVILVGIWFFLFKGVFSNELPLFPDGRSYFHWNKFFIDSFREGVYPLWNPLRIWGSPVGFKIRFIGEFNPFLLVLYIPYFLGAKYGTAYFFYALSYYVFGALGLGLIAKQLFKDKSMAFLSGTLFLFSGSAIAIFFNYCEVALTVPMIWFFYFLITFFIRKKKRDLLGLTFALMIIMTTYMPFYFLTVLAVFIGCFAVVYPKQICQYGRELFLFMKRNKLITALCVGCLLLSAVPGYITYKETSSADISYAHRQGNTELKNTVATGLNMINPGSIVGPLTWEGLFSGLMFQKYYLSYFFLSIFIYPVLFMSVVNKVDRRMLLLLMVSIVLFLISLTNASGLHQFLYEHIFFFKLIRNIFYFFYMALPFIVLFVIFQLKTLVDRFLFTSSKWMYSALVILVHALFIVYLYQLGFMIISNYLTVFLSAVFFLLLIWKKIKSQKALLFCLGALIVIQPIEVFKHYTRNVSGAEISYRQKPEKPTFFFSRPKYREQRFFPDHVMTEGSGFISNKKFVGMEWIGVIQGNISRDVLNEYVPNKFYVYDNVEYYSEEKAPWEKIESTLGENRNIAFITDQEAKASEFKKAAKQALMINENTPEFSVESFNLNKIVFRTNFEEDKFIVYNDAFHKDWKATINGVVSEIYRANVAFKGIWVPAGEHTVMMRYRSKSLELFYFVIWALFYLIAGYLAFSYLKSDNKTKAL